MSSNTGSKDNDTTKDNKFIEALDGRSRDIFKNVVEAYLETGAPLGSKLLANSLQTKVSPATIRNVMSDLEHLGLIYSPHTSSGRLPTNTGLRFFVDSFLEIGDLTKEDRESIDSQVRASNSERTLETVLTEASQLLSGLTQSASLVTTAKQDLRLKQIEFVSLEPTKVLVIIVGENGQIENRIINLTQSVTASALQEATNYMNAHIAGKTIDEAHKQILNMHKAAKTELDALAQDLVDRGLAVWGGTDERDDGRLIVSGHANLLGDFKAADELEHVQKLFQELEARDSLMKLLELAEIGEGVRIFIGSENRLFSASGSSLIVSPYRDKDQKVIGALGIIGPTRLNYARIVPMVDYTAKLVSRLIR
ncbi:MAG: heat-inducible transcriptional repressor HrcA [Nitratireductor sp.]